MADDPSPIVPQLVIQDLGRRPYKETLALQQRLVQELQKAKSEPGTEDSELGTRNSELIAHARAYLLLVEHDPSVITFGRRGPTQNLLATRERLESLGIELHEATRGGDVTWHGPGQLVAYPILRIDSRGRSVHGYVRDLEESVIRLLAEYEIVGVRRAGMTGVWVGDEKICAIGVAVSRWVTYHGLALNVAPDLSAYELIIPCGIRDYGVTSLARLLGQIPEMAEVKERFCRCFAGVFGFGAAK
ncbi:MAG: lipoyl(octanoyl) transferase LipB [Candidatus Sumerlaeota bacterium]|nr:lipoyl(octanoyl) transferase LipB [Candidatus Sumerlaeota bacterium]